MAINLELSKKHKAAIALAHQGAAEVFRPISRKYDLAEHEYPKELDTIVSLYDGLSDAGQAPAAASLDRAATDKGEGADKPPVKVDMTAGPRNGGNMDALLNAIEMCWGDAGLVLAFPYQGLGNSAIAAVATDEQLARFGRVWASMAITEPSFGSDSAAVSTTAKRDGDEWVLNGTKIFITSGSRSTHIVVWATVDKSLGRAAIKSFVVPREHPGVTVARVEDKLGMKASDTAEVRFEDCRIPFDNILGDPEVNVEKGFAGVMQTFDNTRPMVAGMAIGVARASLEELRKVLEDAGIEIDYDAPINTLPHAAAEFIRLEGDWEAAYQLALKAAWLADNKIPNSKQASMAKAKAGRVGSDVTLKAVEIAGGVGYSERTLLEKWARDSKILDIFEGTQQIQQLIIARRQLELTSAQLK